MFDTHTKKKKIIIWFIYYYVITILEELLDPKMHASIFYIATTSSCTSLTAINFNASNPGIYSQ